MGSPAAGWWDTGWEEGLRPLRGDPRTLLTLSPGRCAGVHRVPCPALGTSNPLTPLQGGLGASCPKQEATSVQKGEAASPSHLQGSRQRPRFLGQGTWCSPRHQPQSSVSLLGEV